LVVAIIGSSMAFIDSTAVNVALPSMQRDLQSDAAGLQWVIEGYTLFLSALILVGGSLGDIFGRRLIFVIGIALFAAASAGCAGAQSIFVLNAARCVQGIGAALATPGSLALISANFSGAERGRAIGTWSGFGAMTAAIGPLLGGWLTQHASWRDVFLINVPLAVFVIVATLLRVPESRTHGSDRTVDIGGALLATGALGASTYGHPFANELGR
jgi:MFS family permease